jgi:hypothetical protein
MEPGARPGQALLERTIALAPIALVLPIEFQFKTHARSMPLRRDRGATTA